MRLDLKNYAKIVLPSMKLLKNIDKLAGDNTGEVTPVPIPNTDVKLSKADGTCGATRRESR